MRVTRKSGLDNGEVVNAPPEWCRWKEKREREVQMLGNRSSLAAEEAAEEFRNSQQTGLTRSESAASRANASKKAYYLNLLR